MVLRLPSQAVAQGEARVDFPIVLTEKGCIEERNARRWVVDDRDSVGLWRSVQIACCGIEGIRAIRACITEVGVAIEARSPSEVKPVISGDSCQVVLELKVVLIVSNVAGIAAAIYERALNRDCGQSTLGGLLIADSTILEAQIVDDVFTQHETIADLKLVLDVVRVVCLEREIRLPDALVRIDGAAEIVTKGERISLTELEIDPLAQINPRVRIAESLTQDRSVRVRRRDARRVGRIHDTGVLMIAREDAEEIRAIL
jgi:hypothetical protein